MPRSALASFVRRLRASDSFADSLRIFFALAGIVGYCQLRHAPQLLMLLLLGAIAAALAETEDTGRRRLRALLLSLGCFAIAVAGVKLLLPHPLLFALVLPLASFSLLMSGALGDRRAAIGMATLVLAIYAMLVFDQATPAQAAGWQLPLWLLAGASWYGLLALVWNGLFPQQAVRQALAAVFEALAGYLACKARLFEPDDNPHPHPQRRQLALAMRNERVMQRLNEAWALLLDRLSQPRTRLVAERYLRLYFLAQSIHDRASSAHHPYQALGKAFFHSDVLFRIQRLILIHAQACHRRAQSLRMHFAYTGCADGRQTLTDLQRSIDWLMLQPLVTPEDLRRPLYAIQRNLGALQQLVDSQEPSFSAPLAQPLPRRGSGWRRLRAQLHPGAARFRYALRLSLALLAGYGLMRLYPLAQGFWILLTIVFVCQPSYGATRRRQWERIGGTFAGLLLGWALLTLFPQRSLQLACLIATGPLFFATRRRYYLIATGAATLMVLFCFNQVGSGYALILPRLIATLLGTSLGWLATRYILPDWQLRRLNLLLACTLRSNSRYLREVITFYISGDVDEIAYRHSRNDALAADAALSVALSNMLQEPRHRQHNSEVMLRFLAYSHRLLGHLSALGAHRSLLGGVGYEDARSAYALIERSTACLSQAWEDLADQLEQLRTLPEAAGEAERRLVRQWEQRACEAGDDDSLRLVQTLLAELLTQLDGLRELGRHAIPPALARPAAGAREAAKG